MRRTIAREVVNPIAQKVIAGEYRNGAVVVVDYDSGSGLSFHAE
jgi:hypothetical protein